MVMNKSDEIFKELLQKQLKKIQPSKKLQYNDIKRISKYITNSIFDENNCCIWNGYVTNSTKKNKGMYINFYFNSKKVALHRLLYVNFIDTLGDDEYLKFNCENKGKCCNIHHLKKFKYNPNTNAEIEEKNIKKNPNKLKTIKICYNSNDDDKKNNDLYIDFD